MSRETSEKLMAKANAAEDKGEMLAALDLLRQAAEADRTFWFAWFRYGVILGALERHSEAIVAAEEAIALKPDNALPYALAATSYRELGSAKCIDFFIKAVSIKPRLYWLTLLSDALCQVGDYRRSIEYAEWALRLDPEWEEAQDVLREARNGLEEGEDSGSGDSRPKTLA